MLVVTRAAQQIELMRDCVGGWRDGPISGWQRRLAEARLPVAASVRFPPISDIRVYVCFRPIADNSDLGPPVIATCYRPIRAWEQIVSRVAQLLYVVEWGYPF